MIYVNKKKKGKKDDLPRKLVIIKDDLPRKLKFTEDDLPRIFFRFFLGEGGWGGVGARQKDNFVTKLIS